MGNCLNTIFVNDSLSAEEKRSQTVARSVDKYVKNRNEEYEYSIKILLLGTGDSGKSTFAKQMQLCYDFDKFQNRVHKNKLILRKNALDTIKEILDQCELQGLVFSSKEQERRKQLVIRVLYPEGDLSGENELNKEILSPKLAKAIKYLWDDYVVREMFRDCRDYLQISSSAEYYLDNVRRFAKSDFVPEVQDILRAKHRTTGIHEVEWEYQTSKFILVDVGGQRSERKKWINCFDNVSAVIFVSALNEYNLVLEENGETNRMSESIALFEKLTNSEHLQKIPWIIFLNKSDIFNEKIETRPLMDYFKDYDEVIEMLSEDENLDLETEFSRGVAYIARLYSKAYKGEKGLYTFTTNSLDSHLMRNIFLAVRDSLITTSLRFSGF
eukprot:TRINITY_DN3045_c0_g1_i1.p1 TRINITY_DN3045_c0_g1~~TRINITY_DN3045_c0_g1_i1.p1  ORF type:complete len:384 (-),score=74.52 TRINITY_DN3045_c0_g1_i1:69-1220(-)